MCLLFFVCIFEVNSKIYCTRAVRLKTGSCRLGLGVSLFLWFYKFGL